MQGVPESIVNRQLGDFEKVHPDYAKGVRAALAKLAKAAKKTANPRPLRARSSAVSMREPCRPESGHSFMGCPDFSCLTAPPAVGNSSRFRPTSIAFHGSIIGTLCIHSTQTG